MVQKLSPRAARAKHNRDVRYASYQYRIDRRSQNQGIGQSSDKDIHHASDGSVKKISIKDNRGFYGKGTKKESRA